MTTDHYISSGCALQQPLKCELAQQPLGKAKRKDSGFQDAHQTTNDKAFVSNQQMLRISKVDDSVRKAPKEAPACASRMETEDKHLVEATLPPHAAISRHPRRLTESSGEDSSNGVASSASSRRRCSRPRKQQAHSRRRSSHVSSSPTFTSPPIRNLNDVLSLHSQSCTIFRQMTLSAPSSPQATKMDLTTTDVSSISHNTPFCSPTITSHGEEEEIVEIPPATIIYWTSFGTRRREYAEIDKWSRGLRGFWRRVAPRWFFRRAMQRFHESDRSDAGSVRRYRLEIPEDEKSICSQRGRRPTPLRTMSCF